MEKKFVAYLDILGFKALVKNNPLEKLIETYTQVMATAHKNSIGILKNYGFYGPSPLEMVKSMMISDSIILWSNVDSPYTFMAICITVQAMLYTSIGIGMPLRGAIVHEELEELKIGELDNYTSSNLPILLGRGLVDAYTLEGCQEWSGCIVSDECISYISQALSESGTLMDTLIDNGILIKYKIPFTSGKECKVEYAINWPVIANHYFSKTFLERSFGFHNKVVDQNKTKMKIQNTIEFNEYCWREENLPSAIKSLGPRYEG